MVYYVNTPYNQPVYSTPVYMAGPAGSCARAPLMPQFGQGGFGQGGATGADPNGAGTNGGGTNGAGTNGGGTNGGGVVPSSDMWKMLLMSPWTWILVGLFIVLLFILMRRSSRSFY